MTRRLVVGNWKMHKTPAESAECLRSMITALADLTGRCDVAIAPTFLALGAAAPLLEGSGLALAAQNTHWEEEGPFTGEVSPKALKETGCRYVIIGHSERREHFGETDRRVNRKARSVLFWGMSPIVCVGEKLDERSSGRAASVVQAQLKLALANLRVPESRELVVAYEPVWAIGTGRNATAAEASEMHALIRDELSSAFGPGPAAGMRVLYGGSVSPANAGELLSAPGIDGALVGGASLETGSFRAICEAAAGD